VREIFSCYGELLSEWQQRAAGKPGGRAAGPAQAELRLSHTSSCHGTFHTTTERLLLLLLLLGKRTHAVTLRRAQAVNLRD
jgi:hypothetical protein